MSDLYHLKNTDDSDLRAYCALTKIMANAFDSHDRDREISGSQKYRSQCYGHPASAVRWRNYRRREYQPMSPRECQQTAFGLHDLGRAHRDSTPANIPVRTLPRVRHPK